MTARVKTRNILEMENKKLSERIMQTSTHSLFIAHNNSARSSSQAGIQGEQGKFLSGDVRKRIQLSDQKIDEQIERANIFNSRDSRSPAVQEPDYSAIGGNIA